MNLAATHYHRRVVVIRGVYRRAFEESSLYEPGESGSPNEIDSVHVVTENGTALTSSIAAACSGKRVLVYGEFIDERKGLGTTLVLPSAIRELD